MAKKLEREGFIDLTIVKNFLAGFKHTKHSKVFLRIEQIDGYNYLCVYLDNNYTADEVTNATRLNEVNGFRKWFHIKLNKAEVDEKLMHTAQEITVIAWPKMYGEDNPYDVDSMSVFDTIRGWAKEFEDWWNREDNCQLDYIEEVENFAEKKVNEWLSYHE